MARSGGKPTPNKGARKSLEAGRAPCAGGRPPRALTPPYLHACLWGSSRFQRVLHFYAHTYTNRHKHIPVYTVYAYEHTHTCMHLTVDYQSPAGTFVHKGSWQVLKSRQRARRCSRLQDRAVKKEDPTSALRGAPRLWWKDRT